MSILTTIGQYIPGSENYGHHEKNIAPLLLAAPGLIKAGASLIGAGARNRELDGAKVEQRERQYDYENFDYNQDVGAIENPYAELTQKQQEFSQRNIDSAQANAIQQQQNSGNFGATGAILAQQNKATQKSSLQISGLRAKGAQFVEKQRQSRISDKYDQAGTFLARSDERLAGAKRAKARAKEQLVKGISGAVGGAAGAVGKGLIGGGGLFGTGKGLGKSGIAGGQSNFEFQANSLASGHGLASQEQLDFASKIGSPGYNFNF